MWPSVHARLSQRTRLTEQVDKARSRSGFSFDLAQKFIASGLERPIKIEQRINEIAALIPELDAQKQQLIAEIGLSEQNINKVQPQVFKIDILSNKLIKLYRKYRNYELSKDTEHNRLYRHSIYSDVSSIRASTTEYELIK